MCIRDRNTASAFQLDVTQEEDWRSVFGKSRDVGEVDIVVNNAGYFPNYPIEAVSYTHLLSVTY